MENKKQKKEVCISIVTSSLQGISTENKTESEERDSRDRRDGDKEISKTFRLVENEMSFYNGVETGAGKKRTP